MSEKSLDGEAPSVRPRATKPRMADHHFVRKFAASMPAHIAETFSDAQLRAIIRAYGVRSWGRHAIDFRFTLPVLARTCYFVFLAGIDKRPRSRNRAEQAWAELSASGPLQGRNYRIEEARADIGTVFRLQALAPNASQANALCGELRSVGIDCQVRD